MATTPQGNFAAYQQLKPTQPLLVGDLYNGLIDNMINRNDAKKAAELKALQEHKKTIGERFDKIKIDPFATTNNLTDASSKAFKDTYEYYSEQRRLANEEPANAYTYLTRAENAAADFLQMSKTLGDSNFIKLANEKAAAVSSEDYDQSSDDVARYKAIANGNWERTIDPQTGKQTFYLPKNDYSKDSDEAVKMGSTQFLNELTVLPQKNLIPASQKEIADLSSKLAEEWKTNTDGNITKSYKDFADERAKSYFKEKYGDYNEAYVPSEIQQWSRQILKRPITSAEDYNAVIDSKINMAKSLVEQNISTDTKYMAIDIAQKKANLENTKARTKKMQEKEQQLAVPTAETSIIRTYNADGSYQGYYTGKTAAVNLAGTTNFISAQPVEGKDGKVYNKYYIGGFAKDGNIVYEPLGNPKLAMTSAKIKDPIKVFAQLNDKARTLTPIKYGTRQKIVPKSNEKSRDYELTSVNIKAKASEENAKKDFENALYQGLLDNQNP